ncbi:MAG: trypsin-like peptidase domain-containing protein [Planctomycetota bacterium]
MLAPLARDPRALLLVGCATILTLGALPCVASQPPVNATLLAPAADGRPAGGPMAAAVARARDAVVHVLVEIRGQNTFAIERPGSGVVVTASGLVATHWDLVREADNASDKAVFVLGCGPRPTATERRRATIVAHDDGSGLALLQVDLEPGATLPAVPLAPDPRPGDAALVLGLHDGEDLVGFAGVVTPALGDVALASDSERRVWKRAEILLTDAAIEVRSHGAALLSATGGLLGLCSAVRVLPMDAEPTLADLKRPSFGFVVPTRVLRRAFASELASAELAAPDRSVEADAVARVGPSVVGVFGGAEEPTALGDDDPYATRRRAGHGSGVVLTADGLVLTSRHLVRGSESVRVTLPDGTAAAADVVRGNERTNSALLKVRLPEGKALVPLECGDSDGLAVGQRLLVVGRPDGTDVSVRAGALSAKRGRVLQVDAGIGNHNSGGAIVTLDGLLVGLADAGTRDQIDIAFEHRGERAKVDTSLDLSPSIDLLRAAYRLEFDRHGSGNETLARPRTPGPSAALGSVADVVEATAGSLLNVYVQTTTAAADLDDNPFAEGKGQTSTEGLGSGVVVDRSGLALTNWHVVDSATEPDGSMRRDHVVRASLRDGRSFPVTVLSISREEDLALLQLHLGEGDALDAVELGASDTLSVGDLAIAVGNPLGRANTVTAGVVSAKNQSIRVRGRWRKLPHLVETDAAINAGNSGGALLDGKGRLIGINSAGGSLRAVTGYAIGVDHVRAKLQALLLSPEKLRCPYVGLSVVDKNGKVVVQAVDAPGPAAAAEVQTGDVLRTLAGAPVRWSVGWALAWRQAAAGEPTAVEIERDGKVRHVELRPWSAATWAAYRQTGVQLDDVSIADAAALVTDAAVALARHFTDDPQAAPGELPAGVVRVTAVHPALAAKADVRPGDVLLGVIWREAGHTGDAGRLERFVRVADLQRFVNAHGSYDGETFEVWLYRAGHVHTAQLDCKRLPW